MEVGSGFSLQDTVRAQVGVSPAGQGVGGPGCAGGRSMGCGNRARPSLWAPGRGSGAGGGWALQTGVGGGNGARFCSHSWKHPRQLVAMPGLPADLTTTTWSVRRAKTDRYLFRLSRREPVWGEILVRSPLHPAAININLSSVVGPREQELARSRANSCSPHTPLFALLLFVRACFCTASPCAASSPQLGSIKAPFFIRAGPHQVSETRFPSFLLFETRQRAPTLVGQPA